MKDENNIEKFFKNRLEREKEFAFREEDWEKMESQLDTLPPTSTNILSNLSTSTKALLLTVAGISLIMVGWFGKSTFDGMNDTNVLVVQDTSTDAETSLIEAENVRKDDGSIENVEASSSETSNFVSKPISYETETRPTSQIPATVSTQTTLIATLTPALITEDDDDDEQQIATEKETLPSINSDTQNQFSQIARESTAANSETPEEYQASIESFVVTKKTSNLIDWNPSQTPILLEPNKTTPLFTDDQHQPLRNGKSTEEKRNQDKKRATSGTGKWLFGLSLAPESNSIGSPDMANWNAQYGFEIGYKLAPKITLLTGMQFSKKMYKTEGENYSPEGNNFWKQNTNGVIPDLVDGQYSVIDIPLQLKFTWNPASRIRFSTIAGMSNYFLLSETNGFQFKDSNPGAANGWSTKESTNYFLGLMSASIGVEWNFSKNLVVQAAPYVKIPFKKIGFGNVPLFSSGSTISIQYHLNRKRKADSDFSSKQ